MSGRVVLIGAGPGDPGLLTIRGRDVLGRADVVIYDALVADCLLDLAPAHARRVYVGKRAGCHFMPQQEINELLYQEAKDGRFVVRLKGGDPFLFGRGGEEALYLSDRGIPFEIVPGVSAVTAVPAAAGIPVTERELSSCLIAVTGHEDPNKKGTRVDWDKIAGVSGTLVLFMGMHKLPQIVENLLKAGRSSETPVAVIRYGTLPRQQTVMGTLSDIGKRVEEAGLHSPALVVVGNVVTLRDRLNWFEGRPLFGKRVVITRPREQSETMRSVLMEQGACVLTLPMIRVEPPADSAPLREAISRLDGFDWVVFSSTNSVDGFFHALTEAGGDARRLASCRIAAVGPATVSRLRERGIMPDLMPKRFCSEALASELGETHTGGRILRPCSNLAPEDLREDLEQDGFVVERVEAYRVVSEQMPDPPWQEVPHAITFASPSAVTNFVDQLSTKHLEEAREASLFASIGPATTRRMKELELPVHIEAVEHTGEGLIRAIVEHFA